MIKRPNEDLFDLAHSLQSKYNEENPNVGEEIKVLETSLETQRNYLDKTTVKEIEDINMIIRAMEDIVNCITKHYEKINI